MSNVKGSLQDFAEFSERKPEPLPSFSEELDEIIQYIKEATGAEITVIVFVGPPEGEPDMLEDRSLNWSSTMVYSSVVKTEELAGEVNSVRLSMNFPLSQQILRLMSNAETVELASKLVMQVTRHAVSVDLAIDSDLRDSSPPVAKPRFAIVSFEGGVSTFFLPPDEA